MKQWSVRLGLGMLGMLAACGPQQTFVAAADVPSFEVAEPPPRQAEQIQLRDGDSTIVSLESVPTPDPIVPLSIEPPSVEGKAIVVDQTLQVMGLFENGVEIRRMAVSTGRPTYTTYTLPWSGYVGRYWGTFQSFTGGKADDAWFLYEASGSILIHSAPYYEVDGQKEYYDLEALGNYPASAGCIRLHPDDAQWFTDWGPLNAAIRISAWPGEIAGLLADQLPY